MAGSRQRRPNVSLTVTPQLTALAMVIALDQWRQQPWSCGNVPNEREHGPAGICGGNNTGAADSTGALQLIVRTGETFDPQRKITGQGRSATSLPRRRDAQLCRC